jgi:hypothetical protein
MARLVIERARDADALWRGLLYVPPPDMVQFVKWAKQFDDALIERAIFKAGKIFTATSVPESAHRYVSGTLSKMKAEDRQKQREKQDADYRANCAQVLS